jgi:hypothetical protein
MGWILYRKGDDFPVVYLKLPVENQMQCNGRASLNMAKKGKGLFPIQTWYV